MLSSSINYYNTINPCSITFTSHPTNLLLAKAYKDENGKPRRPFLWEEVKYYKSLIPMLMQNMFKNPLKSHISHFNTWVGFDMDRHQDEREGVFLYSYLRNIQAISVGYCNILKNNELKEIAEKIENQCIKLEFIFNEKKNFNFEDFKNDLKDISNIMKNVDKTKLHTLFPLEGINGHYRISSEDLKTQKGLRKIQERLVEVKQIKEIFDSSPVSEIIIADCTSVEEMKILNELLQEMNVDYLSIVPLIEEDLNNDTLNSIVKKSKKKVMLAGSDSIQRETWVGATMLKLKLQKAIKQNNGNIIFFEGTGSTRNRNGGNFSSHMGTILEGIKYERTIQGEQSKGFNSDYDYKKSLIQDLTTSRRCTAKELQDANFILNKIFNEVSILQKNFQFEPRYTNSFKKRKIFDLVRENSFCGSRAKVPNNLEKFRIKDQRAITQSFINNISGFHPEMMYMEKLFEETKNTIKQNLSNPIVQDFINHYSVIYQGCDIQKAQDFLDSKEVLQSFAKGHFAFGEFIKEIASMNLPQEVRERLDLAIPNRVHDIHNYNHAKEIKQDETKPPLKRSFISSPHNLQYTGIG